LLNDYYNSACRVASAYKTQGAIKLSGRNPMRAPRRSTKKNHDRTTTSLLNHPNLTDPLLGQTRPFVGIVLK
jgi:hypothetical protein